MSANVAHNDNDNVVTITTKDSTSRAIILANANGVFKFTMGATTSTPNSFQTCNSVTLTKENPITDISDLTSFSIPLKKEKNTIIYIASYYNNELSLWKTTKTDVPHIIIKGFLVNQMNYLEIDGYFGSFALITQQSPGLKYGVISLPKLDPHTDAQISLNFANSITTVSIGGTEDILYNFNDLTDVLVLRTVDNELNGYQYKIGQTNHQQLFSSKKAAKPTILLTNTEVLNSCFKFEGKFWKYTDLALEYYGDSCDTQLPIMKILLHNNLSLVKINNTAMYLQQVQSDWIY